MLSTFGKVKNINGYMIIEESNFSQARLKFFLCDKLLELLLIREREREKGKKK